MDFYNTSNEIKNFYSVLGLKENASRIEIKSAYRLLAKKHHPDTGGKKEKFLEIQLAWETLNDPEKKAKYDNDFIRNKSINNKNPKWSYDLTTKNNKSTVKDKDIKNWIKYIYEPINRLIIQVIKPLNNEIKNLSADPYDDELMENFCGYINTSRKKIEKASLLFKSAVVPSTISNIGLDLYHCFSQVQDSLDELDRYTQGYVDDYLFDGKEMMKEAKRIQQRMSINKRNISF
tara:strand:- start:336 stop:1034 length:699 start_codon:yes stop_codon:yes gene_type:complete